MPDSIPFDAVIFDLDGTLVATNRFWVRAARTGAKKAFVELGIERPLPSVAEWMSMVGMPLHLGFDKVFADLPEDQRKTVMERCVEEEESALKAGGAALMPDAHEVLAELADAGVRLAIASNCGQFYLDNMLEALELKKWIEVPLCLDSPGIRTKTDMLAQALERFGTRSAVMVGDRDSDREAAWENGLPHVHLTSGYADEYVRCEGTIDGLGELLPLLRGRDVWIDEVRAALGSSARFLGVTGKRCSGKTLFARDLARRLPATPPVIQLEWFRRPDATFGSGGEALARVAEFYDLERLESELFEPSARGQSLTVRPTPLPGARGVLESAEPLSLPAGSGWILEGPFLAHPRIATRLERLVALEVPDPVALRRLAGREERGHGPAALIELRSTWWPLEKAFEAICPARQRADVASAVDPFGQALSAEGPVE